MYREQQFINKYNKSNKQSFNEFLLQAKVKSGNNLKPLLEHIKIHKLKKKDIYTLFNNIQNNEKYLTTYFNKSLKPYNLSIEHEPMTVYNNNSQVQYKNIIRNMFFKQLMENTETVVNNIDSYGNMIDNLYNKQIIDYKLLTPSALHYIKEGRIGSVFSSYYFRASILNPYLVYSLQETILKGSKIFTPTLGWGSYCYGFMESDKVKHYVGTDVIKNVCGKITTFASNKYPSKKSDIYCKPSESLLLSINFLRLYKSYFDTIFFSPPYYDLEKYEGKEQSINNYKTYEEWLEKYWHQTIKLCHHVMCKGGKICYIISNYKRGEQYMDLVSDLNKITKKYFTLVKIIPMKNKNVYVNKTGNEEQIVIFKK
tara:strand:- start:3854 stop:4960 length:1107 start_codon:yes stop_codon:yes gene_type:complete